MASRKKNHKLSSPEAMRLEQKMNSEIQKILRTKIDESSIAAKNISYDMGLSESTIKKWREGRNTPSLGHLLILAHHYRGVLETFLELSGNDYLIAHIRCLRSPSYSHANGIQNNGKNVEIDPINDPANEAVNAESTNLSSHQKWFLDAIRNGAKPSKSSLVKRWGVSERQAKDDIADLKARGLIRFVGAKKNGRYTALPS